MTGERAQLHRSARENRAASGEGTRRRRGGHAVGTPRCRRARVAPLLALAFLAGAARAESSGPEPGTPGGPGLALVSSKILTCAWEGPQAIDRGVLLVRDGKIEAVGPRATTAIPDGYTVLDVGSRWLAPGIVGLHSHQGGPDFLTAGGGQDLNDMVYLVNPGLHASTVARPMEPQQQVAVAGGVTTVLYIPGSGTNISGQGVLFKFGLPHWEDACIRDPGTMKLAQWGNPEVWTIGIGMSFENWDTRHELERGIAYAHAWQAFEDGKGPEPVRNISLDVFRDLVARRATISTHTQMYQVVLETITMIARDLDLPVFLDHSTIGGWLTGELCVKYGVPAIVGPREIDPLSRRMISWERNEHEGVRGVAAGYQERGLEMVGFNTDAPIIPQQELSVQATVAVHYGFRDDRMQALRGLTIVPARTVGIDDRVGSLEPGKDADVLVCDGYPVDPRVSSDIVFVDGVRVYDAARDGRLW